MQPKRGSQGWADATRGLSEGMRGLAIASGFVVAVIGFWLFGRLLDGWLETAPWLQLVGTLIGWVVGFFYVYYSAGRESQ